MQMKVAVVKFYNIMGVRKAVEMQILVKKWEWNFFLFGVLEQDHVLQIYPAHTNLCYASFSPLREMCCYV